VSVDERLMQGIGLSLSYLDEVDESSGCGCREWGMELVVILRSTEEEDVLCLVSEPPYPSRSGSLGGTTGRMGIGMI